MSGLSFSSPMLLLLYKITQDKKTPKNWYILGLIDPIIGPNNSMTSQTSAVLSSPASSAPPRDKRAAEHELPVAAARKVEPRFDDNSVNNSLVIANIGESVALHCRIWMKQVNNSFAG